jgi:Putative mono-oxygenase ydhR
MFDDSRCSAGGIYLFDTEEHARAWGDDMLPAALAGSSGIGDVETQYFEVDERLSQIRHGPLGAAPVVPLVESFGAERDLRELIFTYDAWRTLLGRAEAASVFVAERGFGEDGEPNVIRIHVVRSEEVGDGWTLVLTLDDDTVLRADLSAHGEPPFTVRVPGLSQGMVIRRLEIRDRQGRPRYVGVRPAIQTKHR